MNSKFTGFNNYDKEFNEFLINPDLAPFKLVKPNKEGCLSFIFKSGEEIFNDINNMLDDLNKSTERLYIKHLNPVNIIISHDTHLMLNTYLCEHSVATALDKIKAVFPLVNFIIKMNNSVKYNNKYAMIAYVDELMEKSIFYKEPLTGYKIICRPYGVVRYYGI